MAASIRLLDPCPWTVQESAAIDGSRLDEGVKNPHRFAGLFLVANSPLLAHPAWQTAARRHHLEQGVAVCPDFGGAAIGLKQDISCCARTAVVRQRDADETVQATGRCGKDIYRLLGIGTVAAIRRVAMVRNQVGIFPATPLVADNIPPQIYDRLLGRSELISSNLCRRVEGIIVFGWLPGGICWPRSTTLSKRTPSLDCFCVA
jgi:hypothetical protein